MVYTIPCRTGYFWQNIKDKVVFHIRDHWNLSNCWNELPMETKACIYILNTDNIMTADGLASQGAGTSAGMLLIDFARYSTLNHKWVNTQVFLYMYIHVHVYIYIYTYMSATPTVRALMCRYSQVPIYRGLIDNDMTYDTAITVAESESDIRITKVTQ